MVSIRRSTLHCEREEDEEERKGRKMKTLVVISAFLCGLVLAHAQRTGGTIKWSRLVRDYRGERMSATEYVEVDEAKRTILMSASDPKLRATPYYRADSLHDFNKGLVALKPQDSKRCIVTEVKKSFEDTMKELEQRQGSRRVLVDGPERRQLLVKELVDAGPTESDILNEFCEKREILRAVDAERDIYNPKLYPVWPPIFWPPIYCIWGPIDIFYPYELYQREPERLRNYDGLYSPKV